MSKSKRQADSPGGEPHLFSRRILFVVTGLSPQVVTETLYALTQQLQPAFVPTEVHVLTTAEGAQRVKLALLSEDPGWFYRLCQDYEISGVRFEESNIHVIRDADGRMLDDIRTPEDNRLAADLITELIRSFTADDQSALHVSIAGGRKTMGYYAGYALSLFARPQDRLSHVLVEEPYESSWDFFYPTPYRRVITTRDNKLADTSEARISLAEIPFVSLRHGVDEALREGRANFSDVVTSARRALEPARLRIDLAGRCIEAAGKRIALPPAQLALLSLFARRAQAGEGPLSAPNKHVPDKNWSEWFKTEYKRIRGNEMDDRDRTEEALKQGMDGNYFSSHLSKLRKRLERELGTVAARRYCIDGGGKRPPRFQLRLPPESIEYCSLTSDGKPATAPGRKISRKNIAK